jgi:hypothetical protein
LRTVFAQACRLLADDGTCWLNLGDSYSAGSGTPHGIRMCGSKPSSGPHPQRRAPPTTRNFCLKQSGRQLRASRQMRKLHRRSHFRVQSSKPRSSNRDRIDAKHSDETDPRSRCACGRIIRDLPEFRQARRGRGRRAGSAPARHEPQFQPRSDAIGTTQALHLGAARQGPRISPRIHRTSY